MGGNEKTFWTSGEHQLEQLFGINADDRAAVAFQITTTCVQRGGQTVQRFEIGKQDEVVDSTDFVASFVDAGDFRREEKQNPKPARFLNGWVSDQKFLP